MSFTNPKLNSDPYHKKRDALLTNVQYLQFDGPRANEENITKRKFEWICHDSLLSTLGSFFAAMLLFIDRHNCQQWSILVLLTRNIDLYRWKCRVVNVLVNHSFGIRSQLFKKVFLAVVFLPLYLAQLILRSMLKLALCRPKTTNQVKRPIVTVCVDIITIITGDRT